MKRLTAEQLVESLGIAQMFCGAGGVSNDLEACKGIVREAIARKRNDGVEDDVKRKTINDRFEAFWGDKGPVSTPSWGALKNWFRRFWLAGYRAGYRAAKKGRKAR